MTDIVERLLIVEPDAPGSKSHCFRNPDGPEAAAEIERLREALQQIANGEGLYGAQAAEYKQIARATLEEKK